LPTLRMMVGPLAVRATTASHLTVVAVDAVSPCNVRRLSARLPARAMSAPYNRGRYEPASAERAERRTKDRGRRTAGIWRIFIQRSAFQRTYSTSSADTCSVRTTAVIPSYSSSRSFMIKRARGTLPSWAFADKAWGAGCTASPRSGGRKVGFYGFPRVSPVTAF
jgi:hypothetical protein